MRPVSTFVLQVALQILLPSRLYCRYRNSTGSVPWYVTKGVADYTAGRELHPALKNYGRKSNYFLENARSADVLKFKRTVKIEPAGDMLLPVQPELITPQLRGRGLLHVDNSLNNNPLL